MVDTMLPPEDPSDRTDIEPPPPPYESVVMSNEVGLCQTQAIRSAQAECRVWLTWWCNTGGSGPGVAQQSTGHPVTAKV